jgi:hypothetical protein
MPERSSRAGPERSGLGCPFGWSGAMSASGQKQTSHHVRVMSVISLKADIHQRGLYVRLVPVAATGACERPALPQRYASALLVQTIDRVTRRQTPHSSLSRILPSPARAQVSIQLGSWGTARARSASSSAWKASAPVTGFAGRSRGCGCRKYRRRCSGGRSWATKATKATAAKPEACADMTHRKRAHTPSALLQAAMAQEAIRVPPPKTQPRFPLWVSRGHQSRNRLRALCASC